MKGRVVAALLAIDALIACTSPEDPARVTPPPDAGGADVDGGAWGNDAEVDARAPVEAAAPPVSDGFEAGTSDATLPPAGPPVVLASNVALPRQLRVDGARLYWNANGTVYSVPVTGGAPSVLATTPRTDLEIDDAHVYFWSASGVARAPKDGGAADTVLPSPSGRFTLDATSLVVFSNGTLRRASPAGAPLAQWSVGGLDPRDLGATNGAAFLLSPGVVVVDLSSGAKRDVATPCEGVAVDARAAFCVSRSGLRRVATTGFEVPLATFEASAVRGVAVAGEDVFWATLDDAGAGAIHGMPIHGRTPAVVVPEKVGVFTVDATRVYWWAEGEIRAAAR